MIMQVFTDAREGGGVEDDPRGGRVDALVLKRNGIICRE